MTKCLLCQDEILNELTIKKIFSWEEINQQQLCKSCPTSFNLIQPTEKLCQYCSALSSVEICYDCRQWQQIYPEKLLRHQSLYHYNSSLKEWFYRYKFLGDYRLSLTFAPALRAYFKQFSQWTLVPIPLSKKSLRERGFNQVEALLSGAGLDFYPLLLKNKTLEAQATKTKRQRLKTPQMFSVNHEILPKLRNKKIILIDDVYTTGRTMYHARDCLAAAGFKNMKTFSLAR